MPLMELQLRLPAELLDAWGDALLASGAASVAIEDSNSDTQDEVPLYGEPGLTPADPGWRNNRVSILIDAGIDAGALLDSIARELGCPAPAILHRQPVAEQDWVRQTQAQFGPIRIGRIWIVPSWHEPPDATACNIRIDPGVAFGTGTHPTTRLCLAWIGEHLPAGASVLDYGCGSGILSIGAALLGASDVAGVDIDAQALEAARANALRNGVSAQYTSPESLALDESRKFDLVVANILANPIVLLAPTLTRRVRAGGTLLLSGILERQADAVIAAYRAADPQLHLGTYGGDEGWVAIVGSSGPR
jgi:ribosomal protein L11 methyltransferase